MEDINYIDNYFNGELTQPEIAVFEQKIINDPAFAEEVAFYCNAMQTIKQQSVVARKQRFREIYQQIKPNEATVKTIVFRKWWPYVAAAAVITALVIGWQLYAGSGSIDKKAEAYVQSHYQVMGVQMSATEDSLGMGARLFNENKMTEALQVFENIVKSNPGGDKGLKEAGIVSLKSGNYDKALTYFIALENLPLHANPGKFNHALTLIKRNQPGDKEAAKQLLHQVIDQKLEEKETAAKWLKDF